MTALKCLLNLETMSNSPERLFGHAKLFIVQLQECGLNDGWLVFSNTFRKFACFYV